jgi:hypothetical protein
MSKSEWESGSIVIPAVAWPAFRRTLIEKWNADQDRLLQLAVKMRAEVEAAAKGKRGFDRVAWLEQRMGGREWGDNGESARANDCHTVIRLLGLQATLVDGKWTTPAKTRTPKRKDLYILPVSRGATLDLGEASIVLDDAARTVSWRVGENNHACDTARSLPMARTLFSLLNRIEWTRGSGGKIIGNDEYNQDSDYEGGGGNYVTAAYGPLGGK